MTHMPILIKLKVMPIYPFYFYFSMLFGEIYLVAIAPFIFYFFVTPFIEKKIHRKLEVKSFNIYPFQKYMRPPIEISFYIILKKLNLLTKRLGHPKAYSIISILYKTKFDLNFVNKIQKKLFVLIFL